MNPESTCPACQRPLPANAPGGLCPECLMRGGLGTYAQIDPATTAQNATQRKTRFIPPSAEEIADVFPQLEVVEFIGQGGMGAVYKARQKQLDRVVALKILPSHIGGDSAFCERFSREAKAMARLSHPGIVTIHDFGQTDEGMFYFIMEFVDGTNLGELTKGQQVSPAQALQIVPQVCDALQYAHDQGIVHRDIKPENILLDREGNVKVADFGLAKLVGSVEEFTGGGDSESRSPTLTTADKVMGTPQYMAPEQKERPLEVDHRADVYSLGVVFYQLLTGVLPERPIEPPSRRVQVDVRLDEVVLRALEQEPERRYQNVSALKSGVETIATTQPRQVRLSSRALVSVLISIVAVMSWLVWSYLPFRSAKPAPVAPADNVTAAPPARLGEDDSGYDRPPREPSQRSSTATPVAELKLENSSMEEGDDVPAGWEKGAALPGVEYIWAQPEAYSTDSTSLCLHKTLDRFFPVAQWSQTVPHEGNSPLLQVNARVKAEDVTKATVDAIFLGDEQSGFRHKWVAYIGAEEPGDSPVSHDWKEYSGQVTIPDGTRFIRIALQIYGPGKVWFDDVQAYYAE